MNNPLLRSHILMLLRELGPHSLTQMRSRLRRDDLHWDLDMASINAAFMSLVRFDRVTFKKLGNGKIYSYIRRRSS